MGETAGRTIFGGLGARIILPTLIVIIFFAFPAWLAWHGIETVRQDSDRLHSYSLTLAGLSRAGASLTQEEDAETAIIAGDSTGGATFSKSLASITREVNSLDSLTASEPEASMVSDLSGLNNWTGNLFKGRLEPAAASGNSSAAQAADSQLKSIHSQMERLVSSLINSYEARSNETALAASSAATDTVRMFIVAFLLASLAGLAAVALIARRASRPAASLFHAAEAFSQGELSERVEVKGNDQMARLGRAFNHMASSLQTRTEALLSERSKLRSVHQSITDGILVIGNHGFLISANPAAEAILDKTESALAGMRETGIAELDAALERPELVPNSDIIKCWEYHSCGHHDCPAYESSDLRCWLKCGTHCHDQIQGAFAHKRDACERCQVFRGNSCLALDAEYDGKSYSISLAPILSNEGEEEGRIAVLHDMTGERHRARQLDLLYEIANAIAINTDIDVSLQESLDLCIEAMKATSGSILLIDEDGELEMAAQVGLSDIAVEGFHQHLGEGIAGWVAQQGDALLLNDGVTEPRFNGDREIRDAVCLPIRDENGVVGVLSLNERRTETGFTRESLDFLSPVAVQIGMALSRARLHEKVASEKEKQAAIVECMGESLSVRAPDRTILFANSVHKEIFGDDCVGKRCHELYVGRGSICHSCPLDRCFETGETVRRSHFVIDRMGARRQLEATATPVRDADGNISSCIEVSRDVTEMLRIRDQAKSRLDTLTTLFEVSNNLSSSLELENIIGNLADSTLGALKASAVAIMLFEGKERRLVLRAVAGDTRGWYIGVGDTVDVSHYGLNGLVSGVGPFCAAKPGEMTPASVSLAPPGSQSILVGRLSSRGKLLGLISVASTTGGAFSEPGHMELFVDITNQAAVAVENADMYKRLEQTFWSTIRSLAEAIDAKDSYTRGHSDRVAEYAEALARRMRLEDDLLSAVRCAGYLHDTGKIGIPDAILLKPGRLTDEEYRQIMKHPVLSHKIIEPVEFPYDVKPLVRHHHERMDGSGYPDGLVGEEIPLGARIIGIADAYEAMTSDRPYRKALTQAAAVEELRRCAGTQFDAMLVSTFIEVLND